MKKFRFAILGAGHIARQFCDAVSRIDGCEVCAVASKRAWTKNQGCCGQY